MKKEVTLLVIHLVGDIINRQTSSWNGSRTQLRRVPQQRPEAMDNRATALALALTRRIHCIDLVIISRPWRMSASSLLQAHFPPLAHSALEIRVSGLKYTSWAACQPAQHCTFLKICTLPLSRLPLSFGKQTSDHMLRPYSIQSEPCEPAEVGPNQQIQGESERSCNRDLAQNQHNTSATSNDIRDNTHPPTSSVVPK